jgi:O-antigen ligase
VRSLHGSTSARELQGALILVLLVAISAATALAAWRAAQLEDEAPLPTLRRAHLVAALGLLIVATALVVARVHEKTPAAPARGATTARLGSIESNRYSYWKVAGHMFAQHPLRGEGSGSFGVEWLERRKIPEAAQDAHSLYIETAGELGLVGLAWLALFLGSSAVAARRAYLRDPALTAGWIAALAVWLLHAGLDWDWEMPALSLIAILITGALLAHGERPAPVNLPEPEPVAEPEPLPLPSALDRSDA